MNATSTSKRPVELTFLAGLGLVIAVAAVFAGSVHAPFVFDDTHALVINTHLANLWPPDASLWAAEQSPLSGRPVVAFTFAVDYALGALSPYGYHVVNIALHALTACLLFALLRRVLGKPRTGVAFAAVLLWALHPLQTEAVTYVVQRTELLSAAFIVGCVLAALRGMDAERRAGWFALSVLCCLLGVGSKETGAVAPVLVLLFDRTLHGGSFREALRRNRGLYVGLATTWLALAGLMRFAPRDDSVGFHLGVNAWTWACTQAEVLTHYLRLAFWPTPLTVSYEWPLASGLPEVLPAALLIVGLLVISAVGLARRSLWGLAGASFFVLLAPTSSVVPIVTEVAAERRMYLPLLAVVVLAVVALDRALHTLPARPHSSGRRLPFALSAAALALLASWGTMQRLDTWASAETLWRSATEVRPDNSMAHFMLANTLKAEERYEEALASYEHSLELKPDEFRTLVNMGNCQSAAHLFADAERTHRKTVELYPDVAIAHQNLAILLFYANRMDEAVPSLERCVELEPEVAAHRTLLASMFINLGTRLDEAREHLEVARQLTPADPGLPVLFAQLADAEHSTRPPVRG